MLVLFIELTVTTHIFPGFHFLLWKPSLSSGNFRATLTTNTNCTTGDNLGSFNKKLVTTYHHVLIIEFEFLKLQILETMQEMKNDI
jgi:hypothetical protein